MRASLPLLVAVTALSGCRPGGGAPTVLRVLTREPVVGLDPHTTDDAATLAVLPNIYEPLVRFAPSGALRPALAATWSNPSDTVWRFELRDGVRFHDGRPLRAQDVVYSIRRGHTHPRSWVRQGLADVVQSWAVGEKRVEVQTRGPSPVLLHRLPRLLIVPEGTDTFEDERNRIGTGPYRVEAWGGRRLALSAFDQYWGGRPRWRKAVVEARPEAEERVRAVLDGEADLVDYPPVERFAELGRDKRLQLLRHPAPLVGILGFLVRPDSGPFSDPAVREAIDLALDRASIVREAQHEWARPTIQMVPAGVFGATPEEPVPQGDAGAARAALARSRHAKGFSAVLSFGSAGGGPVATAVSRQLRPLGIDLEPVPVAWEELDQRMQAQRVPAYLFHVSFPTLEIGFFLGSAFRENDRARGMGLLNFSAYTDPALDALLDRADRELVSSRRLALLHQALRTVRAARAWLPLYVRENVYAARPRLRWTGSLDGRVELEEIIAE